ncbi:MAG: ADOP family duplicated permease [Thermoanaerobaculia bacterium]
MELAVKDLRYGFRRLRQRPGPTLLAIIALGLGIGLVTAMFGIVWGTLLRGLPFADSDRLVRIEILGADGTGQARPVPYETFVALRQEQTSFKDLAGWLPLAVSVGGLDLYPEQVNGALVSANLFELLGAKPILGRTFAAGEDQVVVVGERLWRQQLGGTAEVLGRTITVYGEPKTVIGVLPEDLRVPYNHELWVPLDRANAERSPWLQVFGRLRPGTTRERARAELAILAGDMGDQRIELQPFADAYHDPKVRRSLLLALMAVTGVLLVACANVAGLLLAQGAGRGQELAVRTALGASRLALTRQLLAESALLAAGGGLVGVVLARLGIDLYLALGLPPGPFWVDVRLDGTVLAFTAAITVGTALLAGLVPAWRTSVRGLEQALRNRTRSATADAGSGRLHRALVIAQLALATALLTATGLMIDAVLGIEAQYRQVRHQNAWVVRLATYGTSLEDDPQGRAAFYAELSRRLDAMPDVAAAALATSWPGGGSRQAHVEAGGPEPDEVDALPTAGWISIDPGYFEVFGQQLIAGRDFDATDRLGSEPVVLVSRSFAEKHFGGRATGRRLRLVTESERREELPWRTVVGVAPDLIGESRAEQRVDVYMPLAQTSHHSLQLVLRVRPGASGLENKVRRQVQAASAEVPVYFVKPLEELLGGELRNPTSMRTLFSVFGAASLLLAGIGLYGVLSLAVRRRTRELGLRLALGALPADLRRLLLRQGFGQLLIGAAAGLLGAAWLARLLAAVYGVEPWNARVAAAVLATLLAAGALACWLPARRAMRLEPGEALRHE